MYAVTCGWKVLSWHKTRWRADDAATLWQIALAGGIDDVRVERVSW